MLMKNINIFIINTCDGMLVSFGFKVSFHLSGDFADCVMECMCYYAQMDVSDWLFIDSNL